MSSRGAPGGAGRRDGPARLVLETGAKRAGVVPFPLPHKGWERERRSDRRRGEGAAPMARGRRSYRRRSDHRRRGADTARGRRSDRRRGERSPARRGDAAAIAGAARGPRNAAPRRSLRTRSSARSYPTCGVAERGEHEGMEIASASPEARARWTTACRLNELEAKRLRTRSGHAHAEGARERGRLRLERASRALERAERTGGTRVPSTKPKNSLEAHPPHLPSRKNHAHHKKSTGRLHFLFFSTFARVPCDPDATPRLGPLDTSPASVHKAYSHEDRHQASPAHPLCPQRS